MRIVTLSDQHGYLPEIPTCDLLIIAGDVCPDRFGPFLAMHDPDQQKSWFNRKVRPWLAKAPATHKILTWGNHDWCGQACSFPHDSPAEASTTDLQILVDEATRVPADDGSRELLAAIDRVRPKLVICGHIHDGHGQYEYDGIPIHNVTVVDEQYRIAHPVTLIDFP